MTTKKTTPPSGQKGRGASPTDAASKDSTKDSARDSGGKKPADAAASGPSGKAEAVKNSDAIDAEVIKAKPAGDKKPESAKPRKAVKPMPKPVKRPSEPPERKPPTRSGLAFTGFVTGGIIAAALGYFGAEYLKPPSKIPADIAALRANYTASLNKLSGRVAALEAGKNTTRTIRLKADIDALKAALVQENKLVSKQLAAAKSRLDAALDQLAAASVRRVGSAVAVGKGAGAAASGVITQYGAEIDALKKQISAQSKARKALSLRVDEVSKATTEQLSAARNKVVELTKTATAAVKTVNLTQTRERLRVAVETGKTYAGLLAKLASEAAINIPAALMNNADTGIVPLARLQQDFPDAARRALKASILAQAANKGLGSRVLAFLKSQIGARSLEKKAGDGPNAVLSQAQAALDQGDLKAAVGLVRKLPDAGISEMRDWLDAADARLAAEAALKRLETSLVGGK